MATLRGCHFPEDLYYLVEKHVWVKPLAGGLVRVGLTPAAYTQLRNTLVAIRVRQRSVGQEIEQGKSVAMVESLKYNGALTAPFTGVLVRGNDQVEANPDLASADPYDAGWIVEMRPVDWEAARAGLLTGAAALAAYRQLLEAEKISCE